MQSEHMIKRIRTLGAAAALAASVAVTATSAYGQQPRYNEDQLPATPPPLRTQPAQPSTSQPYALTPQPNQIQSQPAYQPPPPPPGSQQNSSPDSFRGDGWGDSNGYRDDRNDRRDEGRYGDWRDDRGRIDFQAAQRSCSRIGIQEAWARNYYSAQYEGGPRFVQGRNGWELRGRMRLHDRSGYRYLDTVCEVRRNGEAVRFDFLR